MEVGDKTHGTDYSIIALVEKCFLGSEVERAPDLFDRLARRAIRVDHGRADIGMPEQSLDRANVVVRLQKMGSERVAEGVGRDAFGELGAPDRFAQRFLELCFMHMIPAENISRGNRGNT